MLSAITHLVPTRLAHLVLRQRRADSLAMGQSSPAPPSRTSLIKAWPSFGSLLRARMSPRLDQKATSSAVEQMLGAPGASIQHAGITLNSLGISLQTSVISLQRLGEGSRGKRPPRLPLLPASLLLRRFQTGFHRGMIQKEDIVKTDLRTRTRYPRHHHWSRIAGSWCLILQEMIVGARTSFPFVAYENDDY